MLTEEIIEKKVELDCDCTILGAINIITGKWKPVIIWMLLSGPRRFGELHKGIRYSTKGIIETFERTGG